MQESIVISTTPPLPGLKMVQDINKALESLGTDFAGASDPAAFAKPFMTWADTGNMLLKRRNAAGSAWVTLGPLLEELAKRVGDATQRFKAAPSAAPDEVVVQSQVFGVGQTRQDKTADRAWNANITNLTGKPIKVTVIGTIVANPNLLALTVDGDRTATASFNTTGTGGRISVSDIIPPGSIYSASPTGLNLYAWIETKTPE